MIPEARLQEIEQRSQSHEMTDGEYARNLLELVAEVRRLRETLHEAIDIAVWMSGSDSFSPDGEAAEGWMKARDRLYAVMEVAGSRAAPTEESEEG